MNRASLLHILDHPTGIGEAEVRALEQLAAAFPYCQTAHLLLAKAAHDRGSMLASQRLRRAATYAANRELLRSLIELPPAAALPAQEPSPADLVTSLPTEPAPTELAAVTEIPEQVAVPSITEAPAAIDELPPVALAPTEPAPAAELSFFEALDADAALPLTVPEPLATEASPSYYTAADSDADPDATASSTAPEQNHPIPLETEPQQPAEPIEVSEEDSEEHTESVVAASTPEDVTDGISAAQLEQPTTDDTTTERAAEPFAIPDSDETQPEAAPAVVDLPATTAGEVEPTVVSSAPDEALSVEEASVVDDVSLADAAASALTVPTAGAADELPAVAPPIRPPAEVGSSRFEFGLSDAPVPKPAYVLPEALEELPPVGGSIPPFRADEHLAYGLSGSSRLGYCLLPQMAELTHALPPAADWQPDALLLAHHAAHRPVVAPPSSLALIERFLRSQPRIKNAATRPARTDTPQTDLSVRSTSAPPSLASESLAKIMVKQGKTARAIEIYEQLMQRQPEKKAYFAAQIDLLNQQPE